ncbi:MAG: peroxiredoxin family protein [Arenicella sp.]
MNKLIGILVVLAVAGWLLSSNESLPEMTLTQYGALASQRGEDVSVGGICGFSKCLTVYVAPWCPACRSLHPTIVSLIEELRDEGITAQLIVGKDAVEKVKKYAKTYPFPVLLDADGSYFQLAKLKAVPTFIVTDTSGDIINKVNGGYASVHMMRDKLKI